MRCITLLTVVVLAMLAVYVNAGKVTINGACLDCNRPVEEGTTSKPSGKAKPTDKADKDEDSNQQSSEARHKRQWGGRQVILTDDAPGGGWSGGSVTTIDGRRYPGSVVRNDDCVGCNIRG